MGATESKQTISKYIMWTLDHHSLLTNHEHVHAFTAITAFILLGRLSVELQTCVCTDLCSFSHKGVLVRSGMGALSCWNRISNPNAKSYKDIL